MLHKRRRLLLGLSGMTFLSGCSNPIGDVINLIETSVVGDIAIGCEELDDAPKYEACGVGFTRQELVDKRVEAWQKLPLWCWAASIQMAFRCQGYEVSQQRIVESTYGRLVNLPAWGWQIHRQISRAWTDDNGRRFVVRSRTLIDSHANRRPTSSTAREVHGELERRRPLIVGTGGHAMLLVAQESVRRKSSGRVAEVSRAMVVDPWPFRIAVDQFKFLRAQEINYTQYLATVEVSAA